MRLHKQQLADRMQRLAAALLDGLVVGVAAMLMAFVGAATGEEGAPVVALLFLILFVGYFVLQLVFLIRDGQTIGKKLMKIKIVMEKTGKNGGFVPNVLLRSFVNGLLTIVPFYGLVDILLIFRDDRRCIHDLLAGTIVVVE